MSAADTNIPVSVSKINALHSQHQHVHLSTRRCCGERRTRRTRCLQSRRRMLLLLTATLVVVLDWMVADDQSVAAFSAPFVRSTRGRDLAADHRRRTGASVTALTASRPGRRPPSRRRAHHDSSTSSSSLGSTTSSSSSSSPAAEFAYQEMRAQLEALLRSGRCFRTLNTFQREEIASHVRKVVRLKHTPPPPPPSSSTTSKSSSSSSSLSSALAPYLAPGTVWRLVFSTEEADSGALWSNLPRDTTVYFHFLDSQQTPPQVDYILHFFGQGPTSFGSSSFSTQPSQEEYLPWKNGPHLQATCSYSIQPSSYDDQQDGPLPKKQEEEALVMSYQQVTAHWSLWKWPQKWGGAGAALGLPGRIMTLKTAYIDRQFWIEQAVAANGGQEYYNVYMAVPP